MKNCEYPPEGVEVTEAENDKPCVVLKVQGSLSKGQGVIFGINIFNYILYNLLSTYERKLSLVTNISILNKLE